MTPRQIIRQISERKHFQSITARDWVNSEDEKCHFFCGNNSPLVHKAECEANKEIIQSKRSEFLGRGKEKSGISSGSSGDITYRKGMYPTLGQYLQGNAILTKSRENEVHSPTRFYDCNKERQKKTSADVSFTTLYTTFKSASEENRRASSQMTIPKRDPRRLRRSESWLENAYSRSEMSNIRGMAKKIHEKSIAVDNIVTASEKIEKKTKHYERSTPPHQRGGFNRGTSSHRTVEKDLKETKRVRLHVYVPTADMNS